MNITSLKNKPTLRTTLRITRIVTSTIALIVIWTGIMTAGRRLWAEGRLTADQLWQIVSFVGVVLLWQRCWSRVQLMMRERRLVNPSLAPLSTQRTAMVARHEAAHAVVAHRLGSSVGSITIGSDGVSEGRVLSTFPMSISAADMHWCAMLTSLAGHLTDTAHGRHDAGSTQDMNNAHKSMLALISVGVEPSAYFTPRTPLTVNDLWAEALTRTREILDTEDAVIEALARRLTVESRLINPDDLIATLRTEHGHY